ncbi:hypothetical protein RF679_18165 [Undibacterium cyanobacteriorum]|uniref:SMP-30/Gluconolactonase/LRE-like region domain-containing protein n=1 Tax=Undibacterium cyanobacteriorum TaxID=3073561 RepID=A0ABY9RH35_9BURK|nr:hypothetical protein [Undibacterium sp. 20NA77.5]WMW80542.1 hypothetical protein RF679_18165 [Undibacterium sp. 20NA77.5]
MRLLHSLAVTTACASLLACGGSGSSTATKSPDTSTTTPAPAIASLIAGSYYGAGNANGSLTAASITAPAGAVTDSVGNMFFVDSSDSTIRKVTPSGSVTSYAGVSGKRGTNDGPRDSANFTTPMGLAIDAQDNLYVSDVGVNNIRKISNAGVVTTVAGIASDTLEVVNGTANTAKFAAPFALAVDSTNNIYVIENTGRLRKISSSGIVSTLAGPDQLFARGASDGSGANVRFNSPKGIAIDKDNNIFIADTNNGTIRKITPSGLVSTYAGKAGSLGSTDGSINTALFSSPRSLRFDKQGNLYVVEAANNVIRKISSAGIVSTVAGNANAVGAYVDGVGGIARFNFPRDITFDLAGNAYVSDLSNSTIRKITTDGMVSTWFGPKSNSGIADGNGGRAQFFGPSGIVSDNVGNYYVSDTSNHTIRKVSASGDVTTLTGSPTEYGSTDANNRLSQFNSPLGLTFDKNGFLYVADSGNEAIRRVNTAGDVTTFARGGSSATMGAPHGLIFDASGNLLVTDNTYNAVRKISPTGQISLFAGSPNGLPGSSDFMGVSASFNCPSGIAIDKAGFIYVADTCNHTIRKINPNGLVSTYAGRAGESGSTDGDLNSARFNFPYGLKFDANDNLYVSESGTSLIRKISPAGLVSTYAGVAGSANLVPDAGSKTLAYPRGMTFDAQGRLVVLMNNGVFVINR